MLGSALKLGFDRLTAIDDAKGKLNGLGMTAQTTAQVMDSALAAVKGTAYGLGDAASIAASAVAAGVKPGQQLTEYLKLTADAASVAGTSLGDMGRIINQVRTGQNAYTEDLNQLAERGLPIYQWIGEAMKVPAAEVKKLASQGKVSSEIFEKAIRDNIGGAALKAGQTVRGSFENLKAALGRAGAAALEGGFAKLPALFASLTKAVDGAAPRIKELAGGLQEALSAMFSGGAGDTFKSLASSVMQAAEPLGRIVASLGQASAAVGVSAWKIFLTTLEAAAGVLRAVAPLLETVANLMAKNQGLVTAFVAGWAAFKTVPALIGRASDAFLPLSTALGNIGPRARAMRDGVTDATGSWKTMVGYLQQANPQMTTAQANMTLLKNGASGLASGGLGLVKGAASGLVGVLGGPLNIALMGATAAFGLIASKNAEASAAMAGYEQATRNSATAQTALNDALIRSNGLMDEQSKAAASQRVQAAKDELQAGSKSSASFLDGFRDESGSLLGGITDWSRGTLGEKKDAAAKVAGEAAAAIDNLKLSQEALSAQISGDQATFDALVGALEKQGAGGVVAAEKLKGVRDEILGAQQAAATTNPVLQKLGDDVVASAARIRTAFSALPTEVPIKVDAPGGQAVYELLTQLGQKVTTDNEKNIRVEAPLAPEVLNTLKALGFEVTQNNDKTISVKAVGAEEAAALIDAAANKPRTASISVVARYGADIVNNPAIQQQFTDDFRAAFGRADGAVVAMAGGGLRMIRKPQTAGLYAGRGAGTIFAEEETGGEAYIPLAPSKRGRSLKILAEVARLFGVNTFADGGLSVDALKAFASRINGRAYQWGAGAGNTFDTDCSGAQSTIVNAITGASGRFSTATQAQELAARGFQTGDPPPGVSAYWVGWVNGGPGGGHTAGTIVDPEGGNVNVEMGGAAGNGQFGGSAAGASSFPNRAWIALAGGDDPNNTTSSSVTSAKASVTAARSRVTSAQARLDQAQAEVDKLEAEGASADKQAVAAKKRDAAQQALDAAMEKQTAAEQKLTEVKEKQAAGADQQAERGGVGVDGQSFGQSLFAGLLQGIGLDGSLFSNPFEWPTVKSVMAGLNWGGGLLAGVGGGNGGPSLPGLDGFIKPLGAPVTEPTQLAGAHAGSGAAPGPGITVNGNIGMDPRQFTQRIDAHQNQAWRRNMSAVRPS